MITLFSILLTLLIYRLTIFLAGKYPTPLTSPVFLSTILIIAFLLGLHISYDDYTPAKNIMTFLLGPATVALAVPIYKNWHLLSKYFGPALIGLIAGTV